MASRYWVGGAGTWDGTTTTHWSTTSGGSSGASVPTSTDDVFIDANSGAGTVNISGGSVANCRAFDSTGFTGTLANGNINANNSVIIGATTTATTFLLQMSAANGVAATLTTNGVAFTSLGIFGAGTGSVTLGDPLTITGALTLTSGAFNTNNKICSWGSITSNSGSTRTLSLGSSSITLTAGGGWLTTFTGFTLDAGTSTITLTNSFPNLATSSNLNNVIFSNVSSGSPSASVSSSATFANLTFLTNATRGVTINLQSAITVTGTFTATGNSAINRILFQSSAVGTARTLTAGSVSLTYVDFMDITAAGTASPFTGTSLGNALGNSNITFDAPSTQTYTAAAGGNWSDVTKWTSRIPLPQDKVVIDANASGTILTDMPRLGADIDCTGFTGTLSVTSLAVTSYGSLTLASGMSTAQNQFWNLNGRGTHTITSNGKTFGSAVLCNIPSGTYGLTDALSSNGTIQIAGIFNTNNFSVTYGFNLNLSSSSRVTMGTSTFYCLVTAATNVVSVSAGAKIDGAQASFVVVSASPNTRGFSGSGNSFGTLTYTVAGSTGSLTISGNNAFGTINFSDASNARTLQFASGSVNTIGVRNIIGTAGKLMTVSTTTPGSPAVLASSRPWQMGANSTNVSGNSGLSFVAGPDMDYLSVQDITGSQTGQGSFFQIM